MKVKKYFLHCYNHYLFDGVRDISNIIDLAHKHETVEIDLGIEGPDLAQFPEKGTKFLDLLNDVCIKNNWPQSKFIIVTSNLLQSDIWPAMRYNNNSGWVDNFLSCQGKSINPKKISKRFGCFICNSSWPRLWISSYLNTYHSTITDQTFLRSLSNPGHAINLDLDSLMFNFSMEGITDQLDLSMIMKFLKKIPFIHDNDIRDVNSKHPSACEGSADRNDAVSDNILSFYENIFVDIVCETFFSGSTFFPTEKTARPFVTRTPFVVMGPAHFLTNLRKLGFKTFSKYWDESYDWLSNASRVLAIGKLIDEIASWDQNKIKSTMSDMKTILDHNHNLYLSIDKSFGFHEKINTN